MTSQLSGIQNNSETTISLPVNLLWTGGWDSTFRLLYLLLVEEKAVQPIYIVDSERPSTGYEIRAMESIRKEVLELYPATKRLFLTTIFDKKDQIQPDPNITEQFELIKSRVHIGIQYDWLARYAVQKNISDLEIAYQKSIPPHDLDVMLFAELTSHENNFRVKENPSFHAISLFKFFRFPLANLTKLEMEHLAKKHNFFEIMKKTWFCHTPKKNGKPCEVCQPCLIARKSGHTHGLPETYFLRDLLIRVSGKVNSLSQAVLNKLFLSG